MLLTELAVQNVAGLPSPARIPLQGGLNAFVSRGADLVRVLRAVLYPELEHGRDLCVGDGPHKAACTVVGRDGATWRIVRDLNSGGQTLLRSDPQTKRAEKVSEDPAEIARHLVVSVGLPPEHAFRSVFSLSASDLPSGLQKRAASAQAALEALRASATQMGEGMAREGGAPPPSSLAGTDGVLETPAQAKARLPQLRDELHRAESLERTQDAYYELQNEFSAIEKAGNPLRVMEEELRALTRKSEALAKRTAEIDAALEQKVRQYPGALSRRDASLADLTKKKTQIEGSLGAEPKFADLTRDPFFGGGMLAGIAATAAAIGFDMSGLWLVNLVAFAVAAFGAWRWVDAVQTDVSSRRRLADLTELGKRIHTQYEIETKPVLALMRSFDVPTAEELLEQISERDLVEARRVAAERELQIRRNDPQTLEDEAIRAEMEARLRAHEAQITALGFSRDAAVVRRELEAVEPLAALAVDDEEPLASVVESASLLCGMPPPAFVDSCKERLAQYLAVLTEQRFVGVQAISPGVCHVVGASGASGPLAGLAVAEQDAIMVAVKLTFAERLGAPAEMPVFVDEPSLLVAAPHRMVFVKMLKALGTLTQVVVRAFDPPPPGIVDHVALEASSKSSYVA